MNKSYSVFEVERRLLLDESEMTELRKSVAGEELLRKSGQGEAPGDTEALSGEIAADHPPPAAESSAAPADGAADAQDAGADEDSAAWSERAALLSGDMGELLHGIDLPALDGAPVADTPTEE